MANARNDLLLADGTTVQLAPEHRIIMDLVPEGSRVLDLGCGEGDLLKALQVQKGVRGDGVELSQECIQACVAKGLFSVHHGDLDEGLADYADKSVDVVLLNNTVQVLRSPLQLMREMARVGRRCIITFPNFGYWPVRAQLFFRGRMPKSSRLPYEWYDTPNIRLTTIADFREFCRRAGLRVLKEIPIRTLDNGECLVVQVLPNVRADAAIFVVEEAPRPA